MSALPDVLVVGCNGQVGTELRALLTVGGYKFAAVDREECDLTRRGAVGAIIQKLKPRVVVNAAAYTAVDKAESEPEVAEAINALAPSEMALEAKRIRALFIHYSTDYVFNGENNRPWTEEDAPAPLGVYGRSKLNGEIAVAASGAVAYTFRTSWVYGTHGSNFLLTMLKLAKEREELSVISDQIGAPTWSRSLADATLSLIRRFSKADGAIDLEMASQTSGLYHATCGGQTSWHGFAEAIFARARQRRMPLKVREVHPIRTEDWPSAAKRPRYSVLSNRRLNEDLGIRLPQWSDALNEVFRELT